MAPKSGYYRPEPLLATATAGMEAVLRLAPAATVKVTVDFGERPRPDDYRVSIASEAAKKVGSWRGMHSIDSQNETRFECIPPGRYTFTGRPNPSNDRNAFATPQTVELKGGETTDITLIVP